MDTVRPYPQIGQENPLVPTSPELEDELFNSFFDWQGYCDSTQPDIVPSYLNYPPSSGDLDKLITEIPAVIDHFSLERLQSEFLRMKTSFSPDPEGATTSSGQTPPELIQGGSTSPSDHSGSVYFGDESLRRPDFSLEEVQAQDDEWTYPQTAPNKHSSRGYPSRLKVPSDSNQGQLDKSSGLKRRHSGHSSERRHRHLVDPDQTADVRKSGACLPCRVTKTRCHESGVCPTCRKLFPDHSHLVCTRSTPGMIWPVIGRVPDVWSSNIAEEEILREEPRFFFGKSKDIGILMSSRDGSSALRATIQAYQSQDDTEESPRKAAFPREKVPSHRELQKWAEGQIQRESSSHFKHSLQNFLYAYADEGRGLPKHDLVSKVHKMNCFFRIWKTSSFSCRDPSNKLVNLPPTVQAELRLIARKALESLEYDVFKQLDDCCSQQGIKSQERPAVWACMWQLMLMYRELLEAFKPVITRTPDNDPAMGYLQQCYQWLGEKVFPVLAVFYRFQFRTKKNIEFKIDDIKSSMSSYKRIRKHGKDMINSRKELYEKIQGSKADIDHILRSLVVDHEVKKLNARKRAPTGSSKSKKSRGDDDDDYE
ncbi:hypothetical protein B0T10DRAFT_117042 [Thelonectria olida]|uniref:Uncharacterized protein n=1 Tax=Thelonectria olida TaxID=1576542 RepID=A0A9P8WIR4_9HYPO|nr:hypothetical protein B0T10DRAFT_117042 [Thelonectria olida]